MTEIAGAGAEGARSKNTLYCSFCGKSQHEVSKLIAGPTVFICNECVALCNDIVREAFCAAPLSADAADAFERAFPELGGARASLAALGVLNHSPSADAPRILLHGAFGSGKLAIAEAACALFAMPFANISAAELRATCAGALQSVAATLMRVLPPAAGARGACLIVDGAECLAPAREGWNRYMQAELAAALGAADSLDPARVPPRRGDGAARGMTRTAVIFIFAEGDDAPDVAKGLAPELHSVFCQQAALPRVSAAALGAYLEHAPSSPVAKLTRRLQQINCATEFEPAALETIAQWCARRYGFRSLDAAMRRLFAACARTPPSESVQRIGAADVAAALD